MSNADQCLGDIYSMFLGATQRIETYQRRKAQRLHSSWSGHDHPGSVGDRRHLGIGSIWGLWGLSQAGEIRQCPGRKRETVERNWCWIWGSGTRRRKGWRGGAGVTVKVQLHLRQKVASKLSVPDDVMRDAHGHDVCQSLYLVDHSIRVGHLDSVIHTWDPVWSNHLVNLFMDFSWKGPENSRQVHRRCFWGPGFVSSLPVDPREQAMCV